MLAFSVWEGLLRFFRVSGLLLSVEVLFDGFVVVVLPYNAGPYYSAY